MDELDPNARWRRSSIRACPRKRHYTSWSQARAVAVRSKRKDGWDHMEPYRCRCGQYAVGHPKDSDANA